MTPEQASAVLAMACQARKDPLAFGGDIKEQTRRTMEQHKKNLESLEIVIKVTVSGGCEDREERDERGVRGVLFEECTGAVGVWGGVSGYGDAGGD